MFVELVIASMTCCKTSFVKVNSDPLSGVSEVLVFRAVFDALLLGLAKVLLD